MFKYDSLKLNFSIIIPVYNRPSELQELLASLAEQTYDQPFEVIVVDDGSSVSLENEVLKYDNRLNVKYFYKDNSGPGLSRNYGMQRATGNYFLIFDSDCIIPQNYLKNVADYLLNNYSDAFGGPDAAHASFSTLQKAINYSMTAMLTTGGLRTGKSTRKYQLRSYNMGLSKKAFEQTGGFSAMRIGEDIDLTFRLWREQLTTQCIPNAVVYHKRRSSISQFYNQTYAFGKARPGLNSKYPGSAKITYWFPSLFLAGVIFISLTAVFGFYYPAMLYAAYFGIIFLDAGIRNKSLMVGLYSVLTTLTQFVGYGAGFVKGMLSR